MRIIVYLSLFLAQALGLSACDSKPRLENELIVGSMAGPESTLMKTVIQVAEREGLQVRLLEFEDYVMPNAALATFDIDANLFQHAPYLQKINESGQYPMRLVSIGKGFVYPMGLYSRRHTNLNTLPSGAKIGIPIDPSNQARALLLLEKAGLIRLNKSAISNTAIQVQAIQENPLSLQIIPMEAATLPRLLEDLDIAAINTNYALPAGLEKHRLFQEDKDSLYANVLVVRESEQARPAFQTLLKALHSQESLDKAKALFGDQAIPAWETKTDASEVSSNP